MHVISVRNVNEALPIGMDLLRTDGVKRVSRGMEYIEYPEPVATVYKCPRERVLFDPHRDANPFFHFMEALWILAGREDVRWLAQFNSNMAQFSDDGIRFHAPYGYRLRTWQGFDQIERAIAILQQRPDSRQVVLQIWDAGEDLATVSKDIPCNDMVFLKIRDDALHMTVCCRSNDIIWGAYGANVVQFSMLQEYIAAVLDIDVGPYTQVSDSFHVYPTNPYWNSERYYRFFNYYAYAEQNREQMVPWPLFTEPELVESGLKYMFSMWDRTNRLTVWPNFPPLINEVAVPMYEAWQEHKRGETELAVETAKDIVAPDWRHACVEWLKRRVK